MVRKLLGWVNFYKNYLSDFKNLASASAAPTDRVSNSHFHHIFASQKGSVMTIEGEQGVRLG